MNRCPICQSTKIDILHPVIQRLSIPFNRIALGTRFKFVGFDKDPYFDKEYVKISDCFEDCCYAEYTEEYPIENRTKQNAYTFDYEDDMEQNVIVGKTV